MAGLIEFVLGNFTLTFLVIAAICTAVGYARRQPDDPVRFSEPALRYYCLVVIGFTFIYNFVFHVFLGKEAAYYIGWADSPFQAEVGWASLGFAVVGLLGFKASRDLRLAAIIGPSCFLLGAASGHIIQMVTVHNFAPGNAGIIFWTDIIVPVLGFVLFRLRYGPFRRSDRLSEG